MRPVNIIAAATAFANSYGTTYDLYRNGSSAQALAENVASYYRFSSFTSLFIGNSFGGQTFESVTNATIKAFDFLEAAGVGNNVHMDSVRVEYVSDASALCWITWHIEPKNNLERFSWTTLYGYRSEEDLLSGISANSTNGTNTRRNEFGEDCNNPLASYCATRPSGGWEFGVNDDEIVKFSERVPNYIDSYVFPETNRARMS